MGSGPEIAIDELECLPDGALARHDSFISRVAQLRAKIRIGQQSPELARELGGVAHDEGGAH
jgi:hypothetical protein